MVCFIVPLVKEEGRAVRPDSCRVGRSADRSVSPLHPGLQTKFGEWAREKKEGGREGGREESDKKWPVGLVWDPPPAADVQCAVCQLFVLLVLSLNQEACIKV